jgi:hypothetical protein
MATIFCASSIDFRSASTRLVSCSGSGLLAFLRSTVRAHAPTVSGLHPGSQATINAMQHQFREGDWVRHRSFPEPIRVIGIGSTIAVQFPNGEMLAFEPYELEKVSIAKVPQPKVPVHERRQERAPGSAKRFVTLATSIGLICLIILVLAMIAGARP